MREAHARKYLFPASFEKNRDADDIIDDNDNDNDDNPSVASDLCSSSSGMDHEEFARKVNASDAIQRWVHSIPLHHVSADGLPICPALGNDALRAVSQLSAEEIKALVENGIASGIHRMLSESVSKLKSAFSALD